MFLSKRSLRSTSVEIVSDPGNRILEQANDTWSKMINTGELATVRKQTYQSRTLTSDRKMLSHPTGIDEPRQRTLSARKDDGPCRPFSVSQNHQRKKSMVILQSHRSPISNLICNRTRSTVDSGLMEVNNRSTLRAYTRRTIEWYCKVSRPSVDPRYEWHATHLHKHKVGCTVSNMFISGRCAFEFMVLIILPFDL